MKVAAGVKAKSESIKAGLGKVAADAQEVSRSMKELDQLVHARKGTTDVCSYTKILCMYLGAPRDIHVREATHICCTEPRSPYTCSHRLARARAQPFVVPLRALAWRVHSASSSIAAQIELQPSYLSMEWHADLSGLCP